MQKKTAAKIIKNKIQKWIETITDDSLRSQLRSNVLVSGGSIASLLLGEDVNDYDVYIMDKSVLVRLVKYYTDPFGEDLKVLDGAFRQQLMDDNERLGQYATALRTLKSDQVKIFIEGGAGYKPVKEDGIEYSPAFFSPNAISLTEDLQIVVRFYGSVDQIHKTFDFIHATNYWTFQEGIVLNLQAMESLMSRQLKYQGSLYPLTSIIRTRKFIKRKWNIGSGEYLKIMFQISELNLKDPDVLEEQLIGVDVAYFEKLIDVLRSKFEKEPSFDITCAYICELIDRIFGEE